MDNVNNSSALINNEINILSREGGNFISSVKLDSATQTITLTEPSIVKIHGAVKTVVSYERQGNDLIIHMMDGSIVICKDYFFEVDGTHSELVFTNDAQELVHVTFPESQGVDVLIPEYQSIEDISPLYLVEHSSNNLFPLGLGALAILGAGVAIANSNSNSKGLFIDLSPDEPQPPAPTVVPLFGDNVLNLAESQNEQVISGTTGITGSGQSVTVSIAGNTYTANVDNNGGWNLALSPSILSSLAQGEQSVTVVATNSAGLTGTVTTVVMVDTIPPLVTVDPVTQDNVVNLTESNGVILVTGTSEPGAHISLNYDEQQYTTTVDAQGVWSIELPPNALSNMSNGIYTLTITATDSAQNSTSVSESVTMALIPPAPTLNVPFNDDILNSNDVNRTQRLSGVTNSFGENQTVVVNIGGLNVNQHAITQRDSNGRWEIVVAPEAGGHTYVAQVDINGNWVLDLPPEVLQQLDNGTITITVAAADGLGNYGIAPQQNFYVDTIPPTLILDPVAIDNIINGPESINPLVITGSYADLEIGQPITLVLNNITYTTVADGSGLWSIEIPSIDLIALPQGEVDIVLSASDLARNNSTQTKSIAVDTQIFLTVDPVAGDDIINAAEASSPVVVSGTADAADSGHTVTVTLGGTEYTTTVQTGGAWSLSIPSADITALADGPYDLSVSLTDAAGNSITVDHSITLSAGAANLPTLTLSPVSGDGYLNATEATSPLTLSGTSTNVTSGQVVTLVLNGVTYTATVGIDGTWSTTVPVADLDNMTDDSYQVTATVSDTAGNPASDSQPLVLITDSANLPTLSVNPVTADDIVSATESQSDLTVSGGSTNLQVGQLVTVTINDIDYTGTVGAGGSWSVTVPTADAQALSQGSVAIAVSAQDIAGNPATASDSFTVDTLVNLTVGVVAGDDIINAAEAAAPVVVSGTADVADSGQTVTVTLDGTSYTTTVQSDGSWSLAIPSADITALADGPYDLSVSLTDAAGNSITVDHSITLSAGAANLPTLTLSPVSGDGYLNATEATSPLTLSGTSTNVTSGQVVTLVLNGVTYTATVGIDGTWSTTVPVADLDNMTDDSYQVTATVSDTAGNPASDSQPLVLITDSANLPTLSVNPVTADDIVSATESQSDLTVSGGSTNLQVGQLVTVTINDIDYTGTVGAGGSWSVTVPTADAQALSQGSVAIAVSAQDIAGNPATASDSFTVDTLVNLTVGVVAGDDIINAAEAAAPVVVSGTADVADSGQTVTVTLDGTSYTTTVQSDGSWSLAIPSADITALADGPYDLSVSLTDAAGNSITVDHSITLSAGAANLPTLTLSPVSGDGYLNATEATSPLTLSGTSTNVTSGQVVTLVLNGVTYTATVGIDGTWSTTVPVADLDNMTDDSYQVTATVSDTAGNPASDSQPLVLITDSANLPTLSVNPVTADDIVSATESQSDLTVSGGSTNLQVGQSVTVTINDIDYTGTVGAGGSWSVTVPTADAQALSQGSIAIAVSAQDIAGNPATASDSFTVDTLVNLTVGVVAGDDIINAAEAAAPVVVSGTADVADSGQTVTVILDGTTYTTTVQSDGSWSLSIPSADITALADGPYDLSVSLTDAAGNSITVDHSITLSAGAANLPTLTLSPVSGDGYLNATEATSPLTLSGTSTNVTSGQVVTLVLNGVTYTATVGIDGTWSTTVPVADLDNMTDDSYQVTATVSDTAGNPASDSQPLVLITDSANLPTLSVNPVTADDIVSATESQSDLTVSGGSTNLQVGQSVTVTINDIDYTGTVGAGGSWSVTVPTADAQALSQGSIAIAVSAQDIAGNPATASDSFTVDTLVNLTVGVVAGDDIINAAEASSPVVVSGTADAADSGQTVTVILDGTTYTTTVQSDGAWSLSIPSADITALADGPYDLSVSLTDAAGNSITVDHSITLSAGAANLPTLTLSPVSGDGYLNATEATSPLTLSGTSTNVTSGQVVTLVLNGVTYTATVGIDGTWSTTVPVADLDNMTDDSYQVTATVSDTAGNPASDSQPLVLITDSANLPTLSVNPVTADDIVSATESQSDLTVSGGSTNLQVGQSVTVTINDIDYTGTVGAGGSWSVTVPTADAQALSQGSIAIAVSAQDIAGNPATASDSFTVDTLVNLTVGVVAGDDIINAAEAAAPVVVSGTADVADSGQTVTVILDGTTYTTTVQSDGSWSLSIPSADITALADGPYDLSVSLTDAAGNSITVDHSITLSAGAANLPTLTLSPVSGDGYLNATEATSPLTLSGTSTNVTSGQVVTLVLNGVTYTATVGIDGTWSTTVPVADLDNMTDDSYQVTATVSDTAGNPASDSQPLVLITDSANLPTLSVNPVTADDIVSATESQSDLTVSGGSTNLQVGQSVTVTINDIDYTGTVGAGGSWSVTVPTADAQALSQGSIAIAVSAQDIAGNPATASDSFTVDTLVNLTVGVVAGDDIINAAEASSPVVVSGTADAADSGQTVTVILDGTTYTTTVQSDGAWSLSIPSADITALADGPYDLSVSLTDAAGNSITVDHSITLSAGAANLPTLTLSPVSGDGYLNATEATSPLTLSGTSTNVTSGQVVTLVLNGVTYTATVGIDGTWSTTVPVADLDNMTDDSYQVTATVSDTAGNPASDSQPLVLITDSANLPTLSVNPVTADDIVSATESQSDLTVSGGSTNLQVGQSVTVTINDIDYTGTVGAGGSWSVTVPTADAQALSQGSIAIAVSAQDIAGNPATASDSFTVDTLVNLTVGVVAGDDIINAAEASSPVVVSGTADAADSGQTVTVILDGTSYTTTVQSDGAWSLSIPSADITALADGPYDLSVSLTDAAGNSITVDHSITLSAGAANLPTLTLSPVSGDGYLNATEATSPLTLSGTSTNVTSGQVVTLVLNGVTYTATVGIDGTWSTTVPVADLDNMTDDSYQVTATVSDTAGNPASDSQPLVLITDSANLPTLSVNPVTADDIVSATESQSDLTVSGGSTNLQVGQLVTVTINDIDYTGTVGAGGSWSVTVPTADAQALSQGSVAIAVSAQDIAGNPATASDSFTVDTLVNLTVGVVAGDDIINAAEAAAPVVVSGTADVADSGQTVTVILDGTTYTTTVQSDGAWSLSIPSADITALADGPYDLSVSLTDAAGNSITVDHSITLSAGAANLPTLTLTPVSGDGYLNATEATSPLTLSGTSTNVTSGQVVTLVLNGVTYTATVGIDGTWSTTVPVADLDNMTDDSYQVTATVSDTAGNPASDSQPLVLITDSANLPTLSVNPVTADDIVSATESQSDLTVSGGSTNLQVGQLVTVTINDIDYTGTVGAGGSWSVTVPTADAQALSQGSIAIAVSAQDIAGNPATASDSFTVDTLVNLTVGVVAGDDIINTIEAGAPVVVSGTADAADSGQTVTVILDGTSYTTTVQSDGAWSLSIPSADITALADGPYDLSVSLTDAAGNSITVDHSITVDVHTNLPTITINALTGDNYINAQEITQAMTVTGNTTNVEEGQMVMINLNGQNYTGTVQEDGSWSLVVPAEDMGALLDREYTITGSVSDVSGNSVTILGGLTVDTQIALNINTVAGDDIIDNTEAALPVTINGTASPEDINIIVTVTLNGVEYTTAILTGGIWSLDIPAADIQALPDGPYTLTAAYIDGALNSISVSHNITIDASAPLSLTINDISDNNYINSFEINQDLLISGTSTGVAAGRTVTVTFNNLDYTAIVQTDGSWSLSVPALSVGATPDNVYVVSASVTNTSGTEATAEHVVIVDTYIALTIEPITGDDIVNAAELTGPVRIFGIASGDDVSSVITLTMGTFSYTINPNLSGAWSFEIPAADLVSLGAGNFNLHATMGDLSGNVIAIDHPFTISTSTPALAIDAITGDDYINALEANSPIAIGGSTVGIEAGQIVTITLNGISYTATVGSDGSWSTNVPVGDIQALPDNAYSITGTVSTVGGNDADTSRVLTFMTETVNQPTLSINSVTADNTLSANEITTDLVITGSSTHIHPGLSIVVTLNGDTYSGQVGSNGNWQITVPVAALEALPQGSVSLEVTSHDLAGNSATQSSNFTVDTEAARLSTLFSLMTTEQNIDGYHSHTDSQMVDENMTGSVSGINSPIFSYPLIDLIEPTQTGSQINHSANNAESQGLEHHLPEHFEDKDGQHSVLLISAEDEDSGYITLFNSPEEIRNANVQHTYAMESQSFDVYHSVSLGLDNTLTQENIYM
ncbi:Ig-like domain-containing protein [Limnobaculum parvum]|nr:Ig-like domain-containing protein [Limnobaculum parvum]